MTILTLYLLHGAAGGWDELLFLVVPLVIVFAIGTMSGRKAKQDPEEPAHPPDDEAAETVGVAERAGAPEKEGEA